MPDRTYSRDEVQAILSRALEGAANRGDDLSHEDLRAIGRELGITDQAIDAAALGIGDELVVKRAVEERIRRARRGFANHLVTFAMINALLAAINFAVGGPLWFFWSVLGWGIGLVFHARSALLPDRERLAERAKKQLARDREREDKRARRERMRGSGKRIEAAVQDVVAETLGVVADAISDSRKSRSRGSDVGVRVERGGVRVDDARANAADSDADVEEEDERAGRRRRR